jgi:hypothetical protein
MRIWDCLYYIKGTGDLSMGRGAGIQKQLPLKMFQSKYDSKGAHYLGDKQIQVDK